MFENIEKILRCRGKLCVEKERYGDGIFLGIDIAGYIDNATDDKDASIVYTGNDIANAIDIATSPGDMDAMEALEKLETYADEHSEFLFALAKTLEEGFLMLEHKAKLWNKLSQEQTDNLLLNFVQHNPTLL